MSKRQSVGDVVLIIVNDDYVCKRFLTVIWVYFRDSTDLVS